ncbi:MAG: hypothetical protein DRJ40_07830 [Thermoprotei archaeon]|nr:MAG: hypothetical protein DRJ40_07830 [Thermoprotei archaeon]
MNIRWDSSGLGFTWTIGIVGTGILRGRVRRVSTRNGVRIVRSVYLVPKRSLRDDAGEELLTEWYEPQEFSKLVDAELKLLSIVLEERSRSGDPVQEIKLALADLEKLLNQVALLKARLEKLLEVVSYGRKEENSNHNSN